MRAFLGLYGECTISDSQRLIGKCLQMPVTEMEDGGLQVEWLQCACWSLIGSVTECRFPMREQSFAGLCPIPAVAG